jgi:LacI family transcriptional regulator
VNTHQKPPTIVDVARMAGVSRSTASRALGGYGRISDATVAKVRNAAFDIGYRRNELAAAMRGGRTGIVGLVVLSDFTSSYFDRATKAITDEARNRGLQVLIANTDGNLAVEEAAVNTLIDKQVEGLIVVASSPVDHRHLTAANIGQRPLVLFDRKIDGFDVSSVSTDDFTGAEEAVAHAVSRGHRRLGFIVATSQVESVSSPDALVQISTSSQRREGFLSGARKAGLNPNDLTLRFVANDSTEERRVVREMLDAPNPPSAILTSNNQLVIAVLQEAAVRGLTIGVDISVLTFDDSPWAEAIPGGLTVISRPVEQLAYLAVNTLIDNIADPSLAVRELILPCSLTVRGSVADLNQKSFDETAQKIS